MQMTVQLSYIHIINYFHIINQYHLFCQLHHIHIAYVQHCIIEVKYYVVSLINVLIVLVVALTH